MITNGLFFLALQINSIQYILDYQGQFKVISYVFTDMIKSRTYLGIATLGVLIAPIISFPQDISFGDSRQIGFGGGDKDDNVKPKINGKSRENSNNIVIIKQKETKRILLIVTVLK